MQASIQGRWLAAGRSKSVLACGTGRSVCSSPAIARVSGVRSLGCAAKTLAKSNDASACVTALK